MKFSTVYEWLDWIGSVHNKDIELGLDRIKTVAERLGVLHQECPVIVVGGTNGKGSVVAGLESIYLTAGYQVGAFTSPYLFTHNEEVRVNGKPVTDDLLCKAFDRIEAERREVTLTPFEYHTLAALVIFHEKRLDALILEIGLGGRLDAVNVIDADVAVVTSIAMDHMDWLGDTREAIAFEKAGIFRNRTPAVCGDDNPPLTLVDSAKQVGAQLFVQGKAFKFTESSQTWSWQSSTTKYVDLPKNHLLTQNMSSVVMAVTLMQRQLPVSEEQIRQGLQQVKLTGRLQKIAGEVEKIFDVGHNPAAIEKLAQHLGNNPVQGKTYAVFSMLADKDIRESLRMIMPNIDGWFVAPLRNKRAASSELLQKIFQDNHLDARFDENIAHSYQAAQKIAKPGDRIVIFGSFSTVSEAMRAADAAL